MRHLTAGVFAWALIASCLVFESAHSQTKPANKIDTGTVSGRITVKGKGMPGVVVGLRPGESDQQVRPSLRGTSDEDGKYRISNVPPGSYQVAPIAPTFVFIDASNSGSGGKALLIADGEAVEGFDFALARGGVITGKVTDAEGRPVIEEYVHLAMEDQSPPPGSESVKTDDRGIYRAFGVPPGQYRVSAGLGDDSFSGGGRVPRPYRRTFYPSITDPAQAAMVEVAEATEATNIDITVVRMATGVSASGRVVESKNGEPVANVRLSITKITVQGNSTSHSTGSIPNTNMKGEFRAESLSPGKYTVSISRFRESLRADPVTFDVLDQDVTGLLIKTSMGASLAGTVVIQGSPQDSALQKIAPLFIAAHSRDESPQGGSGRHSAVNPDGSFHLSGLEAGTIHLSLGKGGINRGRGIAISQIERDGLVQPDGIQIQNGEQVTGLRVITTIGTGTIRGKVNIENGPLQPGWRLFVNLVKLGEQPTGISPEVDARGHFIAAGLTSGSYEIWATVYTPGSPQSARSGKQLVTVADGVVSEVTITVDLNQNPRPTP
ncbi:MAG: hypothetical protein H0U18_00440 [Pyrinomonadaceae bacterium]|nr:hypothetical protein [Pyrinomonadaceae bacterium]